MNGLLNQAKSRIWSIVNELTSLRYNGLVPQLEIALYEYGKDSNSPTQDYVKQLIPFTNDLDDISAKLFSISTNGGSEHCGAVIQQSLDQLNWSKNKSDLKMIYIAGNEPFNQGKVDYLKVMPKASERQIYVNTIYCGPYQKGVQELWLDGAQKGGGDYFNIDHDKAVVQIQTPFDDPINSYNDSINRTYLGYGAVGQTKKANQITQDANAESLSPSSMAERSIAKTKSNYQNESWDLLDGAASGKVDITKMKEDELPVEFKGLTPEQREKKLVELTQKRAIYQKNIAELAKKRQEFIQNEQMKNTTKSADDFGSSINKSINKQAVKIGYTKESN